MNYIHFHPFNEFKIKEQVRLIIYDYHNKKTYYKYIINSNDSLKLQHDFFKPHWKYKYKYQVKNDKDQWVDHTKFNRIKPEVINENHLKYLLYQAENSDVLIVVFQAINTTPTYNYISTLNEFEVNKLFIKDDYGKDPKTRSSYYLGENKDLHIADSTQNLIKEVIKSLEINSERIIFMGSSKGGYAALYHGYKYGAKYIIAGGPQVLLGNYLISTGGIGQPIFKSIIGDINSENQEWGNNLMKNVLRNSSLPYPNTYIHVGFWEPHFEKHVLPFMQIAKELDINGIELNVKDYNTHKDLIKYFPNFIKKTIKNIFREF